MAKTKKPKLLRSGTGPYRWYTTSDGKQQFAILPLKTGGRTTYQILQQQLGSKEYQSWSGGFPSPRSAVLYLEHHIQQLHEADQIRMCLMSRAKKLGWQAFSPFWFQIVHEKGHLARSGRSHTHLTVESVPGSGYQVRHTTNRGTQDLIIWGCEQENLLKFVTSLLKKWGVK